MGVLILTQPQPAEPFVQALRQLLPQETVFADVDLARQHAEQVEAVLLWRLTPGLLSGFSKLRFVAASAAGVEKILGPDLPDTLPLTRTVDGEQNLQIAQYVSALVLRHVRGLALYEAQQREHLWKRHAVPSPSATTVGLLGLGESGRVVATALGSLGFSVCGWSRNPKTVAGIDCFHGQEGLQGMLPRCQVLVCLLPLTAQTRDIIDADLLQALPRGAFFINVARGGHVVESDLAAALHSGQLAGAALDVQVTEPLPAESPLWDVPRLQITPHIASLPSAHTVAAQFAENLLRARRGEALLRLVDRTRGY